MLISASSQNRRRHVVPAAWKACCHHRCIIMLPPLTTPNAPLCHDNAGGVRWHFHFYSWPRSYFTFVSFEDFCFIPVISNSCRATFCNLHFSLYKLKGTGPLGATVVVTIHTHNHHQKRRLSKVGTNKNITHLVVFYNVLRQAKWFSMFWPST